jgi:hypothetical protein
LLALQLLLPVGHALLQGLYLLPCVSRRHSRCTNLVSELAGFASAVTTAAGDCAGPAGVAAAVAGWRQIIGRIGGFRQGNGRLRRHGLGMARRLHDGGGRESRVLPAAMPGAVLASLATAAGWSSAWPFKKR